MNHTGSWVSTAADEAAKTPRPAPKRVKKRHSWGLDSLWDLTRKATPQQTTMLKSSNGDRDQLSINKVHHHWHLHGTQRHIWASNKSMDLDLTRAVARAVPHANHTWWPPNKRKDCNQFNQYKKCLKVHFCLRTPRMFRYSPNMVLPFFSTLNQDIYHDVSCVSKSVGFGPSVFVTSKLPTRPQHLHPFAAPDRSREGP